MEDSVDPNTNHRLLWAAKHGDEAVVKQLLEQDGIDLNPRDNNGRTPLILAVVCGHEAVVKQLLEQDGIDLNPRDGIDRTPLSLAAESGRGAVMRLLLKKDGVELNPKDNNGRTPLSSAAWNGCKEAVEQLLAKDGVHLNDTDNNGQTPLSLAAKDGREAVVKQLLAKDGVKLNARDNNGQTPLMLAVAKDLRAVVEQLLAKDGVNLNTRDNNAQTPLMLAVAKDRRAAVKQLLEKDGVDLNARDNIGRTALSLAAKDGCEAVVKQLIAKDGVDLNARDNNGRTPLILAVVCGHEAVVKHLVAKDGVDLNARDNNGWTPLVLAAEYRREAVQLLLLSKRIHRRIIICCDGTWNDRETKQPLTNVTRVQSCFEARDDCHGHRYDQISYYIDGIGTGTTVLGSIKDGSTGQGISRKIREAYRHVCSTYVDEHDQIVLIGFSRGAYTVQCLARLINDVGLIDGNWLNKELPEIFKLWTEGQSVDDESSPLKARCDDLARRARLRQGIQIKAYAVWDTVKSLAGKSKCFNFVGERLPSNIEKAFQALALDERRKMFRPVVLTCSPSTDLKQCWFLGSHSDIGGGYKNSGLANISLCWMISQLRDLVKFSEAACWEATDEGSILRLSITRENSEDTEIVGTKKNDSFRGFWWLGGSRRRHVGDRQQPGEGPDSGSNEMSPDSSSNEMSPDSSSNETSPDASSNETSPDASSNEMIHFSVRVLQWELTKREPPQGGSDPLEGFKLSPDKPGWVRTVAGQTRQIAEEDPSEYEIKMLQRWIDQDMEFEFETSEGGGQPLEHLDSILLYGRP
ncbi:hypothetical protein FALCPG4_015697 [Fusarium falciforme]